MPRYGVVIIALLAFSGAALGAVSYKIGHYTVVNLTGLVEMFKPAYVLELGNCDVYVYVAKSFNDSTPMLARLNALVPPPQAAAGVDFGRLVDALLKLPGGEVEVDVAIYGVGAPGRLAAYVEVAPGVPGYAYQERATVGASNYTELVRKIAERLGVAAYERAEEAQERLREAASRGEGARAAFISSAARRMGDVVIRVDRDGPYVYVWTTNLTKALEALKRMEEGAGREIPAYIWVGSYWLSDEQAEALRNAAMRWEEEMGTRREFNGGVEGLVHIFTLSDNLGPIYLVFPYVNGVPPDEEAAKRLVGRFVELAGFCPQPLVAEFWPKTGLEIAVNRPNYAIYIAPVIATAMAATALMAIWLRRR